MEIQFMWTSSEHINKTLPEGGSQSCLFSLPPPYAQAAGEEEGGALSEGGSADPQAPRTPNSLLPGRPDPLILKTCHNCIRYSKNKIGGHT